MEEKRPGEYFPIEEDQTGSFILNAQDLNMIEHIDELRRAGVDSLKIEGRNKRAFYVATVVHAYRQALDGGDVESAARELLSISHRPYSTGFYYGRATQSPERDGYVKECVHVATVEECESAEPDSDGNPRWRVTAACHNAFEEGGQLEVLSPHRDVFLVRPRSIAWLAPADGGKPFVERGEVSLEDVRANSVEFPVAKANRSKEHYVFFVGSKLQPGDYLSRRL